MVGPKHLKTPTSQPSVSHPAQTDDLLKLLAAMQDGLYDLSQVLSSSLISSFVLSDSMTSRQFFSPPFSYQIA